jgi:hypothetical protein
MSLMPRPELCASAIAELWCGLCNMFILPFEMFGLGFVSDEEFVSLAQVISLLFTLSVLLLLLFGVESRCVRSFSSRRHFALCEEQEKELSVSLDSTFAVLPSI